MEVKKVSDRLTSLKQEIKVVMLDVVSAHAPKVGSLLEDKEE